MALETATYISGLVSTNPLSTDPKSQGDDHLRLIKSTLQATFPNLTGAVTATHTELNYVAGVTSSIQAQLNGAKPLDKISAATGSATLANAANQISWNWTLAGASGKGFAVSETAASTSGAGSQDLVAISTLAASTANPLRVTARGSDAILVGRLGDVAIGASGLIAAGTNGNALTLTAAASSAGDGGSINITAGASSTTGGTPAAGSVNITAGTATNAAKGGDIVLTPTTGASNGRVNFVNSSTASGSTASVFTSNSGPAAANTNIQGWLTIKVSGTVRYIPYW